MNSDLEILTVEREIKKSYFLRVEILNSDLEILTVEREIKKSYFLRVEIEIFESRNRNF